MLDVLDAPSPPRGADLHATALFWLVFRWLEPLVGDSFSLLTLDPPPDLSLTICLCS